MHASNRYIMAILSGLVLLAVGLTPSHAAKTWNATHGNWFEGTNWIGGVCPTAGDSVIITKAGASVTLTNSAIHLDSIVLGNATLTLSNWDTLLDVTNLKIQAGGILTCDGPFTNNGVRSRVNVNCTKLTVEQNGSINVKGKGFSGGGTTTYARGHGPGAGVYDELCGGGYGGSGSGSRAAHVYRSYGSATAPEDPGSGGGLIAVWRITDPAPEVVPTSVAGGLSAGDLKGPDGQDGYVT